MTKRDPRVSLLQMRDNAREAVEFVRTRSREDLENDRMLPLALLHLVQPIGEAAGRIPPPERPSPARIPWAQIIAARNRLVHGYDSVDLNILWEIVTADLPQLIVALDEAL